MFNRASKNLFAVVLFCSALCAVRAADPLETYVAAPDKTYQWEIKSSEHTNGFTIAALKMTSQTWRTSAWTHTVQIVRPDKMRHPEIAFLFVTGDGANTVYMGMLAKLASEAGATAAFVTR